MIAGALLHAHALLLATVTCVVRHGIHVGHTPWCMLTCQTYSMRRGILCVIQRDTQRDIHSCATLNVGGMHLGHSTCHAKVWAFMHVARLRCGKRVAACGVHACRSPPMWKACGSVMMTLACSSTWVACIVACLARVCSAIYFRSVLCDDHSCLLVVF